MGLILGCGGRANEEEQGSGAGDLGGVSAVGIAGRSGAGVGQGGNAGAMGGGVSGIAGEYVDRGCPDATPPEPVIECDPLAALSGCAPGFACYPFVDHPFGRGCGVATYGALCEKSGTGLQGDICGDGTPGCAPQHMCVIGSLSGRRCAKICVFAGPDECQAGLVCSETDVEDYGVCT